MLTVGVLGPLDVRRDGRPVAVPSGRTTELLVRLALQAGEVVSADRLIEDLWGAAAATTGRNTLQSKVSQLRRALGEPGRLPAGHGGYALRVDAEQVDALRVQALAGSAAAALRAGDAATATQAASQALALFRGEILVDAGDGEWLYPHRARLEELRLTVVEDHAAARVELGGAGELVAELEALTTAHPLRERLWCSYVVALYRAGRQADALAAFRRVRALLRTELGIEPGAQLRELESRVLQQSAELQADRPERPPPPGPTPPGPASSGPASSGPASPGNVPVPSTPLIGRTEDVVALVEAVESRRLVTVVGPAGVGKSRTVVEVAGALAPAGGVWLVRLDAVDGDARITQVIAETLLLAGGEPVLADRLAAAPTTLVLDNCEHVVDAVAEVVADLIERVPTLRVIATSQVSLGVDGETVHVLEPLSVDDSVALFAERAARARRRFSLGEDDAEVVRSICASLDGLPLAIELAAARTRSLSVHDISRRLDDRFGLLHDPAARRPARRRALSAAIGWSYDLLFPDDQRGLWALSAFAGGAPLAAAEHVLAALDVPAAAAVDVIDRLVDRSVASLEPAENGDSRYRLLDSIRAFGLHRLDEAGLRDAALDAHAAWFAGAADQAARTARGSGQEACVRLVRAERANVDAALAWAARHDPVRGLRIVNGFGWTWVVLGDGVRGAARIRSALDACGAAAPAVERTTALLLAGWLEASAGNVEQARRDLDTAGALADAASDERAGADCDRHLAFLAVQRGRPDEAVARAAASLAVCRRRGWPWETAAALLLGASGSIMRGDTRAAARDADEAVALLTELDDSWGLVHAMGMLGAVADAERRFADAVDFLERAVARSVALGFLGQVALHLTTLGRVRQRAGQRAEAVETLTRAVAAAGRAGDLRIAATARTHLARARRAAGDAVTARALLEENERWYRSAGHGGGALVSGGLLAALRAEDDPAAGQSALHAVLEAAGESADPEAQVVALDALARSAARGGDRSAAAGYLDAANAVAARLGHVLAETDRTDAEIARELLRGDEPG